MLLQVGDENVEPLLEILVEGNQLLLWHLLLISNVTSSAFYVVGMEIARKDAHMYAERVNIWYHVTDINRRYEANTTDFIVRPLSENMHNPELTSLNIGLIFMQKRQARKHCVQGVH